MKTPSDLSIDDRLDNHFAMIRACPWWVKMWLWVSLT